MATLRTIAETAGVHVATASAVLNAAAGNTRVGEKTRLRVLAAAKKHGYVPNELARRLRTGRSNVVGFLGGDLRNPYFAELTAALEAELGARDLQLVVSHLARAEPTAIDKLLASLRQQQVKSIIRWEEHAAPRAKRSGDVLSIGFTREERPGVWLDLKHAIETAVKEMTRRGYRRLGFFFPRILKESPSVIARSEIFFEACRKRALTQPVLAAYEGESWDLVAAIEAARRVLRAHAKVQAWLGFNDIASLGLLRSSEPKFASRVICFDGTTVARCWPGAPTCFDLRIPEFARSVAAVVAGRESAARLGQSPNWLQPRLVGPQSDKILDK